MLLATTIMFKDMPEPHHKIFLVLLVTQPISLP